MTAMQAQTKLMKAFVRLGGPSGFVIPWDKILEILKDLFGQCPTQTVKRLVRLFPGHYQRMFEDSFKVNTHGVNLSAGNRRLVATAAIDAINSTSAADIDSLWE